MAETAIEVPPPRPMVPGPRGGMLNRGGRPAGTVPHEIRVKKELSDLVFGAPNSEELKVMCAAWRKQFLEGTIHPTIATTLMHWWLGKPKETIEVQRSFDVSELTDEELIARARDLADNGFDALTIEGQLVSEGESEAFNAT